MKVLLVNAPPYRIIEPYYDTPDYPRTAIAYLAGYLRAKKVDVHVLDCKYDRLDYDQALEKIKALGPDLVGFTAFTNEVVQAGRLAKLVKGLAPKIKTVIGGAHFTALPEGTLREFPDFDFGVVGEGEETLFELIENINNPEALKKTLGVAQLDKGGQYHFGGTRLGVEDQDSLPFPAWDLFRPAKEYIIHTSRGCPYTCYFCMNPNGRKVRGRSPENVIRELEWICEIAQPKSILMGDEIFTLNRKRVMEICQLMIDRGLHKKFSWWCQTHVRTVELEMVKLMKASNCRLVGLGIESGDESVLSSIFGIMVPYPGTKVGEMAERGEGGFVINSRDWNEYNKQFGNAVTFKDLSRKELERLQIIGYIKVFLYNGRLVDLAKFIWKYRMEGMAVVKKQLAALVSAPKPS